jgi:hypothetical protein
MPYGLHEPIPGGSEYHIEFDGPKQRELITIYLPPVGYTIDRIPDPETGVPTYDLVKCEILGENLPVEKQKWIKPELPKEWSKWRHDEKKQRKKDPNYVHPEAEKYRAREWTRRVNGCWLALGNRNGKPTEYVYLVPDAYFYFAHWRPDFGSPKFRKVYLKTLNALQWAEDHPLLRGIILSTHRRHGKTSIAACWTFNKPSMMPSGYGSMQGQAGKKALMFFDIHLMQPFRRLVDFFIPRYDARSSQKSQVIFSDPPPVSNKKKKKDPEEEEIHTEESLGGRIICVNSSETSLDGTKQNRIWLDEPGKWEKTDVETTLGVYVPCTSNELLEKIGLIFMPSTVEELNQGGQEFINVFEQSMPSLMSENGGTTGTELVAIFISSLEGIVFEEYGRSVERDPEPGEIILNEGGKRIYEGAATLIKRRRDAKKTEDARIKEMRKYPTSWFEAKMTAMFKCQFNAQIITERLQELNAMTRPLWMRGNFQWKEEVDGDVEFIRDDIAGRFQVAWMPDMDGPVIEGRSKFINNVGFEWDEDINGNRIKKWFPLNDRNFACGCDPISYKARGIDPRLSNGGIHIFRKYDDSVDRGKPIDDWETHNFVVQYLFRPDEFEEFGEDVIKLIRFWGVSINAEDNVQSLRQYLDTRGYGAFCLYRRDFTDKAVMGNGDVDRPVRSNDEVIHNYTRIMNTFINRHGRRVKFVELLQQALQFDPNNTQKSDCVVSAAYTLMAAEIKNHSTEDEKDEVEIEHLFPQFDNSGIRSVAV